MHSYDDKPHGTELCRNGYLGYTYSCGAFVFCFYNSFGYPPSPQSPGCVAAPVGTGVVTVSSDPLHGWTSIRLWCMTAAPFANPNGVALEGTDLLGGVSRGTCKSNYGAGTNAQLSCSLVCFQLRMHDTANYWGWDHLVFSGLL